MKKLMVTILFLVVTSFATESGEITIFPDQKQFDQIEKKETIENLKHEIEKEAEIDLPDTLNDDHFMLMVEKSSEYGIPTRIFFRLVRQESRFDPYAKSPAGARGYMQMMPRTFKHFHDKLGLEGGWTPENNIKAGSYFLYELHEYWKKQNDIIDPWPLVLASYNAGPGRVKKLRRIPNISETLHYVAYIIKKESKHEATAKNI